MKLSPLAAEVLFAAAVCATALAQIGILWSTLGSLRSRQPSAGSASAGLPTESPADWKEKPSDSSPRIRPAVEVLWAVLPLVALVILFLATWRALPSHA